MREAVISFPMFGEAFALNPPYCIRIGSFCIYYYGIVIALGFLPKNAPDQICQVALNFICSMQFNTFRQVKGIPAATTFVTNHIRQVGSHLAKYLRHRESESATRLFTHGLLILFFALGAVIGAVCCTLFGYHSIWGSAIILLVIFILLAIADRSYEKELLSRVPHGH